MFFKVFGTWLALITVRFIWRKNTLITCVCQMHTTVSCQKEPKFKPRARMAGRGITLDTLQHFLVVNYKTGPFFIPVLVFSVSFLPDTSVSFVLILLFVISPYITFCTRSLVRILPSWYSNQQRHFDRGRETECYALQAMPRDSLCIFI